MEIQEKLTQGFLGKPKFSLKHLELHFYLFTYYTFIKSSLLKTYPKTFTILIPWYSKQYEII